MIAVALSGGVDSSVAAAMLLEAGHPVVGVTLRLRECDDVTASRSCCGADGVVRARAVAGGLGIRHYVVDCAREFEREVLAPAWAEYARGRTPSPCLLCNERIKFGLLLAWARGIGAERVATGHYARVESDASGRPVLLRGADSTKDQSYFLAGLSSEQLARTRFPLGATRKTEVRRKAAALGLATQETRDSQDACLAGPDGFAEALRLRFGAKAREGEIVDENDHVLGRHDGIHAFTVGQRRRLGGLAPHRLWVKEIRTDSGAVVVTASERALESTRLLVRRFAWSMDASESARRCEVQVRYRTTPVPATVVALAPDAVRIDFDAPIRAAAPGQAAVLYDGARVLGRGWIDAAA